MKDQRAVPNQTGAVSTILATPEKAAVGSFRLDTSTGKVGFGRDLSYT